MDRRTEISFDGTNFRTGLFTKCTYPENFETELNKIHFDNCYIIPCESAYPCPFEDKTAYIFLNGSCDIFAEQLRNICTDYEVEATHVSIDRWINKPVDPHNGILYSFKQEGNSDTCHLGHEVK